MEARCPDSARTAGVHMCACVHMRMHTHGGGCFSSFEQLKACHEEKLQIPEAEGLGVGPSARTTHDLASSLAPLRPAPLPVGRAPGLAHGAWLASDTGGDAGHARPCHSPRAVRAAARGAAGPPAPGRSRPRGALCQAPCSARPPGAVPACVGAAADPPQGRAGAWFAVGPAWAPHCGWPGRPPPRPAPSRLARHGVRSPGRQLLPRCPRGIPRTSPERVKERRTGRWLRSLDGCAVDAGARRGGRSGPLGSSHAGSRPGRVRASAGGGRGPQPSLVPAGLGCSLGPHPASLLGHSGQTWADQTVTAQETASQP